MLSVATPQRRPYIGAYSGHIHRGHTAVGDMLEAGEPLEGGGWVTGSEFYEAELSPSAPPSICKAERLLQRVYTRRAARGARQVAGLALLVTIGCPRSACVHCLPQRQCPARHYGVVHGSHGTQARRESSQAPARAPLTRKPSEAPLLVSPAAPRKAVQLSLCGSRCCGQCPWGDLPVALRPRLPVHDAAW